MGELGSNVNIDGGVGYDQVEFGSTPHRYQEVDLSVRETSASSYEVIFSKSEGSKETIWTNILTNVEEIVVNKSSWDLQYKVNVNALGEGGTSGNDIIIGTVNDEYLLGLAGHDRITGDPDGVGGNDIIEGGAGNDILDGAAGNDKILVGLGMTR